MLSQMLAAGIPEPEALRRHAAEAVRVFLAAYGTS